MLQNGLEPLLFPKGKMSWSARVSFHLLDTRIKISMFSAIKQICRCSVHIDKSRYFPWLVEAFWTHRHLHNWLILCDMSKSSTILRLGHISTDWRTHPTTKSPSNHPLPCGRKNCEMEPATPAGFSPGTQWMQLKTHGTGGGRFNRRPETVCFESGSKCQSWMETAGVDMVDLSNESW